MQRTNTDGHGQKKKSVRVRCKKNKKVMKRIFAKLFAPLHYREGLGVGLSLLFGLLTMTSCSEEDNPVNAASKEQMQEISGHWYAELPISGMIENWRTEEEGDMTAYDKIGALIYLNGNYPESCYWGYVYLKDGDMVNFDGLHRRDNEARFAITMDREGNITPSSYLTDAPVVNNMRYANGIITADISFMDHIVNLVFTRADVDKEKTLKAFYEILAEEGILGGYDDGGDHLNTDVTDKNADEPSRARQMKSEG